MHPYKVDIQTRKTEKRKRNVTTLPEIGVIWPHAKECWAARAAVESTVLPTHWFQTFGLQNCEKISFVLSHCSCSNLSQQTLETNTSFRVTERGSNSYKITQPKKVEL